MPREERIMMTDWSFALLPEKPRRVKACADGEEDLRLEAQDLSGQETFRRINLPHDWAVDRPFNKGMEEGEQQGFRDRWGIGWYQKTFSLAAKQEGYRYVLYFGGIYENSTIWLNGNHVGGRRYGYSSFRVDITEAVREGINELIVKVDNHFSPADRWYSGCGIYRTVKLVAVEEKHLDPWEVVVESKVGDGTAVLKIYPGVTGRVKAVLRERNAAHDGDVLAMAENLARAETAIGCLRLTVDSPQLWSADSPYLYELELTLWEGERCCDRILLPVGIREIAFLPGKGMFVNGREEKLRGVCLHQDVGCRGIAATKELWRQRLQTLKEMGCNAIRPAHHTFAEEFLDLCDEMGFYVYEECFDKWTGGLYGRYFDREWEKDVEAMVKRDRNRACIVIWGVGNEVENQAQSSMLKLLGRLVEKVKSLDQSRPVTCAMNPHFKRESRTDLSQVRDIQKFVDEVSDTEIEDPRERVERIRLMAEYVDLLACNYQEQWYPLIHEALPDKLILGTEIYQYFCGHPDHMQNFTEQIPSFVPERFPYCIGGMVWTGYDYLGESMGYPAKGWGGSLLRTNGEKRFSYYILQSRWRKEPMVHLAVLDQSLKDEGVKEHWDIPPYVDHWHFPQFHKALIPYKIATNCEEVKVWVGERQFALPKPADCPDGLISGYLPYLPGRLRAVGYIGGKEVCRQELVTPGCAMKLEFETPVVRLPAKEGLEVLLTVRARDEEGNPCFRESAPVRFWTEGNASVAAVDNGDICGSEPYGENSIHMFRGCASALIRLGGLLESAGEDGSGEGRPDAGKVYGRITVWAAAEGMLAGRALLLTQDDGHG